MSETFTVSSAAEGRRLDSWKEIAAYLNRDVTTVQRWEKREGMPVCRHLHDKRGSVYAVQSELDAWLEQRRPRQGMQPAAGLEPPAHQGQERIRRLLLGIVLALAMAGLAVGYLAWRASRHGVVASPIRSIAVLPREIIEGDAPQEYLAQ
jgi:hypothetical protein